MKRPAFTLIEMLCVLVIAGLLIAVIGNTLANGLTWSRIGFEEAVVEEQLTQALDFIEQDVRNAVDIDVDYYDASDSRPLSEIHTSKDLRLLIADEGNARVMGRIVYQLRSSSTDMSGESPPERPRPDGVLYRAQNDSLHDGANQPLAQYLNTDGRFSWGLSVAYYGRDGAACSLADEVYSVDVQLAGRTKEDVLVTAHRQIPLTAKFE